MTLDLTAELGHPARGRGRNRWIRHSAATACEAARVDRWVAGAALAVFGVFAAPVVLSGSATFLGYTVLGDTAVHFALIDRIASHGPDLAGLPPSSYRTTLEAYFGSGYPLGAHAALGAVRPLAFVDVAWVFQPFLAFIAAALALTHRRAAPRRRVALDGAPAAVAALAAQPALVYAYAAQGSVKELATALARPAAGGARSRPSPRCRRGGPDSRLPRVARCSRWRSRAPPASRRSASRSRPGSGPVLLVALCGRRARSGRGRPGRVACSPAASPGCVVVLSLPTLLDLGDYLDVTKDVVTAQHRVRQPAGAARRAPGFRHLALGRLPARAGPSGGLDALDVDPHPDRRGRGLGPWSAVVWLAAKRALGPLLFLASSLIALWYVTRTGSPWADAKALAIARPRSCSPRPSARRARGARRSAHRRRARSAVLLAGGVIGLERARLPRREPRAARPAGGARRARRRTAGQGPPLYTEFEEFAKHFLRDADPVGATEGLEVRGLTPRTLDGGRPGSPPPRT